MIYIQEDRMRIRSDDRIVVRHLGLHKILINLQASVVLQTELRAVLKQETQTGRTEDATGPPFSPICATALQDLCESHRVPQHDETHARKCITPHEAIIDGSRDHPSHDSSEGKRRCRDGRSCIMMLAYPVHGAITQYQAQCHPQQHHNADGCLHRGKPFLEIIHHGIQSRQFCGRTVIIAHPQDELSAGHRQPGGEHDCHCEAGDKKSLYQILSAADPNRRQEKHIK